MTTLDLWLQKQRIDKALKHIPPKAFVLDIGCHKGELFLQNPQKFSGGIGIDPLCTTVSTNKKFEFITGNFPEDIPNNFAFDAIIALAVVEHIPNGKQVDFFKGCSNLLNPNGLMICSVPDKNVDKILAVLSTLKLIKGMSLEEHHGYDIILTEQYAKDAGMILVKHERFQLGLNNLFVFKKNPS